MGRLICFVVQIFFMFYLLCIFRFIIAKNERQWLAIFVYFIGAVFIMFSTNSDLDGKISYRIFTAILYDFYKNEDEFNIEFKHFSVYILKV